MLPMMPNFALILTSCGNALSHMPVHSMTSDAHMKPLRACHVHHLQEDVILKVTSTAICGSDLHLYLNFMPGMKAGDILGHEVNAQTDSGMTLSQD